MCYKRLRHDRRARQEALIVGFVAYIARISTLVSQKSERPLLVHLRLCSIYSVKCLIQKQPQGPRVIYPWGTVLVQRGSIP